MDNEKLKVDNSLAAEEPEVISASDEYDIAVKKNKTKNIYLYLLIIFECIVCFVFCMQTLSNDLNIRVTREIENRLTGKNTLSLGTYTGETDFGYFIGNGLFEYKSGSVYNGEWVDSQIHGVGTLNLPSEGSYKGEFKYTQKDGNGIFNWDDGSVYDGEWKNDKMDGQGTYTSYDGVIYKGTFKKNLFLSGTCTFENETGNYKIKYVDGEIDRINIAFEDGSKYVGDCDGNTLSGSGTMTYANGDKYKGEYLSGKRKGNGVYTWKNGDRYDGEWDNDAMSGTGTYEYSEGSCAKGTFENNSFINGSYTVSNKFGEYDFTIEKSKAVSVVMKLSSGTTYSGDMKNGKLTGTAQISYSNGDEYSGRVKNGYKSGQGSYKWSSGASYEGDWSNDKMDGNGTYFYPSKTTGYKLTGTFKKGVPNGECQYYVTSSESYKTDWSNGRCIKVYE